jgi:predicted RNA-binding Zn-ribbon protein involved in translation (DUF1610 family)
VNQNSLEALQLGINGFGRLLMWIGFAWLLAALGLGWLIKSFFVLLGLLLLLPVIGIFGLRWWLKKNLVQDACPVCQFELAGLNNVEVQCPNCGEPLIAEQGKFKRMTPVGTIDVDAVEVSAQVLED